MGTARAEDPARKRFLFSEEAKAVPMESAVFCQSVSKRSTIIRMVESHTKQKFQRSLYLIRNQNYNPTYTGKIQDFLHSPRLISRKRGLKYSIVIGRNSFG